MTAKKKRKNWLKIFEISAIVVAIGTAIAKVFSLKRKKK